MTITLTEGLVYSMYFWYMNILETNFPFITSVETKRTFSTQKQGTKIYRMTVREFHFHKMSFLHNYPHTWSLMNTSTISTVRINDNNKVPGGIIMAAIKTNWYSGKQKPHYIGSVQGIDILSALAVYSVNDWHLRCVNNGDTILLH